MTAINDLRGRWPERLFERRGRAAAAFYSQLAKASAAYWGVELGADCDFFGRAPFRRTRGSDLVIGDRCIFRSAKWSNPAGVNRPCMMSTLEAGAELRVGAQCGFSGTALVAAESVVLDDGVFCGVNVTIMDTDMHDLHSLNRESRGACSPVHIEENVWIGMNVVVLKGVSIGAGSVVGADSVVTKPIPAGVIAAGNPAKVIREL